MGLTDSGLKRLLLSVEFPLFLRHAHEPRPLRVRLNTDGPQRASVVGSAVRMSHMLSGSGYSGPPAPPGAPPWRPAEPGAQCQRLRRGLAGGLGSPVPELLL
jgi:hypothetical protein